MKSKLVLLSKRGMYILERRRNSIYKVMRARNTLNIQRTEAALSEWRARVLNVGSKG